MLLLGRQVKKCRKFRKRSTACWQVISEDQDGLMEPKQNYQAMSQSRRQRLGTRAKKAVSMRLVWGLVVGEGPSHGVGP